MAETQSAPEYAQEKDDMRFSQGVRKRVIEKLVDKALESKDPEQLNIILKAADGMDKNALGKMKVAEKQKENVTAANEAAALSEYLVKLSENRAGNAPPPVRPGSSNAAQQKLPEEQRPNYNPALADPKSSTETSAEFTARMESSGVKPPQD